MKFIIIGWLCSPFLQECVPFQGPEKFENSIICNRKAAIIKRDMKKRLDEEGFANKIYLTCKETPVWHQ